MHASIPAFLVSGPGSYVSTSLSTPGCISSNWQHGLRISVISSTACCICNLSVGGLVVPELGGHAINSALLINTCWRLVKRMREKQLSLPGTKAFGIA